MAVGERELERSSRPTVLDRAREVELLRRGARQRRARRSSKGRPAPARARCCAPSPPRGTSPFHFVEGNAELTPARLVGHFDPARVLADGYTPEIFVDGPLVAALRNGGLLYVEELNRVPEETLNVLITVMSEGELHVPRLGRVRAEPGSGWSRR